MNRYLVESTHAAEECHHVVEQFIYYGHIMNFEWGCGAGVHCSYAMVESENEAEALLSVPPNLRSKARHQIIQIHARKVAESSRVTQTRLN